MAGGDASLGSAALDPNFLMRRLEAIEQWQREMVPSVARTVTDIVAGSVNFVTGWGYASNFAIPSGGIGATSIVTVTIDCPAGFEYMGAVTTGFVAARNTTASEAVLQALIEIGSSGATYSQISVPASATLPVTTTRTYEGPTMADDDTGELNFYLKAGSTADWSATSTNFSSLSVLAMFRRV